MKDETLIILVAVGIGYYLYSKSKTAAAAAATQTTVANPVGTIGTDVTTGVGLVGAVVGAYDQFFNGAASNAGSTNSNSGTVTTPYNSGSSDSAYLAGLGF